jgi:trans-aconitate methyltransferase
MKLINIKEINKYHSERIEKWGICDPRALGYADDFSQRTRFQVIANLFDFNKKCVLDAGCGKGQLKDYLSRRYNEFEYIGVDQQIEFISYAETEYGGDNKCSFIIGDFSNIKLPRADVVVASGALSYRSEASDYHTGCIKKLFGSARKALIFNMLDQSKMLPDAVIKGHDFAKTLNFCKTLTTNVIVATGYLYYDFTLMLRKDT